MEYMMLFRGGAEAPDEEHMKAWMAWMETMTADGYYGSGAPFDDGRVIAGTDKTVTEGNYRGGDVVGGYIVITADDLDQAAERAKACPIYEEGGSVEIRPCREM